MGKRKQKKVEWITIDNEDDPYIAIKRDEWLKIEYDVGLLVGHIEGLSEHFLLFSFIPGLLDCFHSETIKTLVRNGNDNGR